MNSFYAFSRETKSLLFFEVDEQFGLCFFKLNNSLVEKTKFYNFVFLYSTIKVGIYKTKFSFNEFFSSGLSYFITCERNIYSN